MRPKTSFILKLTDSLVANSKSRAAKNENRSHTEQSNCNEKNTPTSPQFYSLQYLEINEAKKRDANDFTNMNEIEENDTKIKHKDPNSRISIHIKISNERPALVKTATFNKPSISNKAATILDPKSMNNCPELRMHLCILF